MPQSLIYFENAKPDECTDAINGTVGRYIIRTVADIAAIDGVVVADTIEVPNSDDRKPRATMILALVRQEMTLSLKQLETRLLFSFLGFQTTAQGLSSGAGSLWLESNSGETPVFGLIDGDNSINLAIRIKDGAGATAADYLASDFTR